MGYYNQLQVSAQADPDRIVAWYKSSGKTLPPYLHDWILANDERVWGAIKAWENQPVSKKVAEVITRAPKPATEHVALVRPELTRKQALWLERNQTVLSMTQSDYNVVLGVTLTLGALIFGTVITLWVVS